MQAWGRERGAREEEWGKTLEAASVPTVYPIVLLLLPSWDGLREGRVKPLSYLNFEEVSGE